MIAAASVSLMAPVSVGATPAAGAENGALESAHGSFNTTRLKGHISVPAGSAAPRCAFIGSEGDGCIRNSVDDRRFGEDDDWGLRGSLTLNAAAVTPPEVFVFDEFALYVPAEVSSVRGVVVALGGPDTRAFVSDGLFGAPIPETEASLHVLGQELRALAADHGLAMLGSSRRGTDDMPNLPQSDELIFKAIGEAARISGHQELTRAPILMYGLSGGTMQAAGFAARHPSRVLALLLKVPGPPDHLEFPDALAVPSYMILAEQDQFSDAPTVIAAFKSNRRAGGLWAMAMEPGVPHHSLSPGHRALTVNWLRAILEVRLGASEQGPVREVAESSGWLGHPDIGVWNWADYPGDRRAASWFPSRGTAEEWREFTGGIEPDRGILNDQVDAVCH